MPHRPHWEVIGSVLLEYCRESCRYFRRAEIHLRQSQESFDSPSLPQRTTGSTSATPVLFSQDLEQGPRRCAVHSPSKSPFREFEWLPVPVRIAGSEGEALAFEAPSQDRQPNSQH